MTNQGIESIHIHICQYMPMDHIKEQFTFINSIHIMIILYRKLLLFRGKMY